MEKQLTVQELKDELSKFNPDAFIINDNFYDALTPRFGWCNMEGEKSGDRDIARGKREATHVSLYLANKTIWDENNETMKPTIKWNADLFGVEIQTKDEHFVISAQPTMVMSWCDAVRYLEGNVEWELPTKDQLKVVSAYISTINDLIKGNGGYEIQGLFWAADRADDETLAWRVYIRDGDAYTGCKVYANEMRAVSSLKN